MRSPASLLDICAKLVARRIPFQCIEERYERIPEPVQERVVFWSFPDSERDICMYSSLEPASAAAMTDPSSGSKSDEAGSRSHAHMASPFQQGVRLLEQGCVRDVLQVGKETMIFKTKGVGLKYL